MVLTFTLPGGAGTQTYDVAAAGTYTMGVGNGAVLVTTTAICVAPPSPTPGQSSYDRAVSKSFLLSRINALLLNSPAATSILYRSNSTVGGGKSASAPPSPMGLVLGAWCRCGRRFVRPDRREPRR